MQLEPFQLEPGDRVRCVDNAGGYGEVLTHGAEYEIAGVQSDSGLIQLRGVHSYGFKARRFKPVIRVKAKCVPTLDLLLKRSNVAWRAMSPAGQEAMLQAQRASWVRGNTGWD